MLVKDVKGVMEVGEEMVKGPSSMGGLRKMVAEYSGAG